MAPRWAAGMMSPPAMDTTGMPISLKASAGTPGGARKVSLLIWVWDVYFSWNQPKHSGPMGNTGQDIMSSFRMS